MEAVTGNEAVIYIEEEDGGWHLLKASHEQLLITSALRLLLC